MKSKTVSGIGSDASQVIRIGFIRTYFYKTAKSPRQSQQMRSLLQLMLRLMGRRNNSRKMERSGLSK